MLGRRTSFFATEREQKEFLCELMEKEGIEVYYKRKLPDGYADLRVECQELQSKPLTEFGRTGVSLVFNNLLLWDPAVLGPVENARAEWQKSLRQETRVELSQAGAIVFRVSLEVGTVLTKGEITVMDKFYDSNDKLWDRPEVGRFYGRIKRKLMKIFVSVPCWGLSPDRKKRVLYKDIHVTQGAIDWEKSGGILKYQLETFIDFTCQEASED